MRIILLFIDGIIGLAEVFLGLRFLLRLFGANPAAPFVQWVYDATTPLLYPFRGIFPTETIQGVYVFDFTTLFAMVAYMVLGYLLKLLVEFVDEVIDSKRSVKHHHAF